MGIIFPNIIHHYQVFGADAHKIYLVNIAAGSIGFFGEELQKYAPVMPVIKRSELGEEVIHALYRMMLTQEFCKRIYRSCLQDVYRFWIWMKNPRLEVMI